MQFLSMVDNIMLYIYARRKKKICIVSRRKIKRGGNFM